MPFTMRIELPQVGESVTEGVIGRWLKRVGDPVERYDALVEVTTDKVNMEMPAPASGVLTRILVDEGAVVPMGAVIAEMDVEGDVVQAPPEPSPPAREPTAIDRTGVLLTDVAPVGPTGSGGPISSPPATPARYSPAVRRLAEQHDVDLSKVTGTGIQGRVTRADVQAHVDAVPQQAAPSHDGDEERMPLSPVRRIIADNMVRSSSRIPQAWGVWETDVTGLVRLREAVRDEVRMRLGVNLTYLAFVLHAVADSLKENPLLNSSWGDNEIVVKRRINIGVAVAAPSGLVVPVIRDADGLTVTGLAEAVDRLTRSAREDRLRIEDVQGGTFTVNNTGALGSVVSRPLVNHPQAAILATEAVVQRPVVLNDAVAIRSMMNLCLTFDHRILDGSEAAAFAGSVKRRLEAVGPDTPID
jgi:2-oxoisovalerate dehydrogenase E2 component (dihydrolipoyl transacylase)